MLMPVTYSKTAAAALHHKVKRTLLTAPVFATFNLSAAEGVLAVMVHAPSKELESRQFVSCFDPEELTDDDTLNDVVDGLRDFLVPFFPSFEYVVETEEEPSAKELLQMQSFDNLETARVKRETKRQMVLEKLFIKRDFFVARDRNDPEYTCGFACNASTVMLLSDFHNGLSTAEDILQYLTYVPNPRESKDDE